MMNGTFVIVFKNKQKKNAITVCIQLPKITEWSLNLTDLQHQQETKICTSVTHLHCHQRRLCLNCHILLHMNMSDLLDIVNWLWIYSQQKINQVLSPSTHKRFQCISSTHQTAKVHVDTAYTKCVCPNIMHNCGVLIQKQWSRVMVHKWDFLLLLSLPAPFMCFFSLQNALQALLLPTD